MKENESTETAIGHFYAPSEAMTEKLRRILMREAGNSVSFDEAEEVGIQLISLYECLARDRTCVIQDVGDGQYR